MVFKFVLSLNQDLRCNMNSTWLIWAFVDAFLIREGNSRVRSEVDTMFTQITDAIYHSFNFDTPV